MNDNTKTIKGVIGEKIPKIDTNGRNYLILKLNNDETIFVFSSNVEEDRWVDINKDQEYNFTVKEGNKGSSLLIDFEEANT